MLDPSPFSERQTKMALPSIKSHFIRDSGVRKELWQQEEIAIIPWPFLIY